MRSKSVTAASEAGRREVRSGEVEERLREGEAGREDEGCWTQARHQACHQGRRQQASEEDLDRGQKRGEEVATGEISALAPGRMSGVAHCPVDPRVGLASKEGLRCDR